MIESGTHCLQKAENPKLMKSQDQGKRKKNKYILKALSFQDTSFHSAAHQISNMMEMENRRSQGEFLSSGGSPAEAPSYSFLLLHTALELDLERMHYNL